MAPRVPEISVQELERRLGDQPPPYVLDVREPWEFARGRVPQAQLIPLGELQERVAEVPRDRSVFVICQSGQRSFAAAAYLIQLGYPDVRNVAGGTAEWIDRGFPLSR